MRVISLFTFLLFALSPVTAASQERVLTHESSEGSYAASIKNGHIESRGAMRVEGRSAIFSIHKIGDLKTSTSGESISPPP